MGDYFDSSIQRVDVSDERLVIRCVREFFPPDGLMVDDVWIWEIENPVLDPTTALPSLTGHSVADFEVTSNAQGQSLLISNREGDWSVALTGTRIQRRKEARGEGDLQAVVRELCSQLARVVSDAAVPRRTLKKTEMFIAQMIDRLQRRSAFVQHRHSETTELFDREVRDLRSVLRILQVTSS